jgi:gamma-glutamylcyclotransferase (GGCT)/AIG2-like uncharacterized protein YtfP
MRRVFARGHDQLGRRDLDLRTSHGIGCIQQGDPSWAYGHQPGGVSVNDDKAPIKLHRIFVYGSLRRGEQNHEIWFGRSATPLADGYIQGAELVNLGAYCCIVPVDDPAVVVVGEVYDLTPDLFQRIETMENSAGYVRRPVEVRHGSEGDGAPPLTAEAYFYSGPEGVDKCPRVESGDWTQRESHRA